MTRQELESKIATTKKNTVLTESQKTALLAMYERKLAELEPEKKEAPAKKEKAAKAEKPYSINLDAIIGYNIFGKNEHSKITGYKAISKDNIQLTRKSTTGDLGYETSFTEDEIKDLRAGKKVGQYELIIPSDHKDYKPKNSIKERAKKVPAEVKEKIAKKVEEIKESKSKKYDCDELIAKAKDQHEKAKERAEAPKKTEVTKSKEKIERAHEAIEKQVESGKLAKAALIKLRDETKELLDFIEKAIKKA